MGRNPPDGVSVGLVDDANIFSWEVGNRAILDYFPFPQLQSCVQLRRDIRSKFLTDEVSPPPLVENLKYVVDDSGSSRYYV